MRSSVLCRSPFLPVIYLSLIAEALLETLDYEEDFAISQEWMEEINRRCAVIDSGVAKLVDHESTMRQLRV